MHIYCMLYSMRSYYYSLHMKPINKLKYSQFSSEKTGEDFERLSDLKKSLSLNLKAQEKLRKIRDDITIRLHNLDEFISTYRLRTEYPPASGILSYLKFERNTPHSLKQQSRVIELQEAIKNTNDQDFEFMKKLNEEKPSKKKKQINFTELPQDASKINFIELAMSSSHYKTGIDVYKAWLEFFKIKQPKRPYTSVQEDLIIEKQKMYKDNWEKICLFIEGRSFQEVYYEFHNRINPKMRTGRWTLRETMMLMVLLEHYGEKKWAQIAQKMAVKSQLQVRERFCNIVDPSLGKNLWTLQSEERLMDVAKEHGYSWKSIAKLPIFRNKTDNCVWRKYRNLMIKKSKQDIIEEMRDCNKKDLVEKILIYKDVMESKKKKAEQKLQQKKQQQRKRHSELLSQNAQIAQVKATARHIATQPATQMDQIEGEAMKDSRQQEDMRMEADERMIYMMY